MSGSNKDLEALVMTVSLWQLFVAQLATALWHPQCHLPSLS